MGQRGPKPKPTALRQLDGSRRKTVNEPHPSEVIGNIPPPEWMSQRAQAIWIEALPKLQAYHLVTDIDLDIVGLYCQTMALYIEDIEYLEAEGVVKYGQMWRRAALFAGKHATLAKQLGDCLGLNAASRTRISLPYPAPLPSVEPKKKRFFENG